MGCFKKDHNPSTEEIFTIQGGDNVLNLYKMSGEVEGVQYQSWETVPQDRTFFLRDGIPVPQDKKLLPWDTLPVPSDGFSQDKNPLVLMYVLSISFIKYIKFVE